MYVPVSTWVLNGHSQLVNNLVFFSRKQTYMRSSLYIVEDEGEHTNAYYYITITKGKYRSLFVCNPVANLGLKWLLSRITWHYFVSSPAIYVCLLQYVCCYYKCVYKLHLLINTTTVRKT
jgi:hypothetical protein